MDQNSVEPLRRRVDAIPAARALFSADGVPRPTDESPQDSAPAPRPQLNGALELVERAAATIDRLQIKSDKFETLAQSLLEQTRRQMSELEMELAEWRRKAEDFSARAEDAERRLTDMETRATQAERLAETCGRQITELSSAIMQRLGPRCGDLGEPAHGGAVA